MSQPHHFRVLEESSPEPLKRSEHLECNSGDAFLVSHTAAGDVLLSLDDVDESVMPTAQMTRSEALDLARALLRHAGAPDRRQGR